MKNLRKLPCTFTILPGKYLTVQYHSYMAPWEDFFAENVKGIVGNLNCQKGNLQ